MCQAAFAAALCLRAGLLAVLGVLRILGVFVGVLGILLVGVLLVFGVFALLHVGHLLFVDWPPQRQVQRQYDRE